MTSKCREVFQFARGPGASVLRTCGRPKGHTGSHLDDRDDRSEARQRRRAERETQTEARHRRRKATQPEATRAAGAVLIRLTPAELAILDTSAADRGMTRSAYVARLARTGAGLDPGPRHKDWPAGTAMAVRAVLAGRYLGKNGADHCVTHVVLVDADWGETEERTLCRRVKVEGLADSYSTNDLAAPTCPECAKRAAR